MTRRALTTTSSAHPIAVTVYGMAVWFGLAHLMLWLPAKAISQIFDGATGARLWGATVAAAGVTTLVSALGASHQSRRLRPYRGWLVVEGVAAGSLAALALLYLFALRTGTPLAVGTQILTFPLIFGCGARSAQVFLRDLRKVALAQEQPPPADPPPVGDPTDKG